MDMDKNGGSVPIPYRISPSKPVYIIHCPISFSSHHIQQSDPYFCFASYMENILFLASLSFLFSIISSPLLCNALSNCNGPCRDLNDCSGQLICIKSKCTDDPDMGTHICQGGQSRSVPTYRCSPPVTSSTKARLTNNDFSEGGDGGGPSECDGRYHGSSERIVALSTGWYNGGSRCGKNIRITARNGRSVIAKVVDECDSMHGCDKEHAYQPPCGNDIVDGSDAVWTALELDKNEGVVNVTWSMA
ncbi:hypothetical protein DITRI_Ditri14bG0084500 [Diplodiscus trichospermus]